MIGAQKRAYLDTASAMPVSKQAQRAFTRALSLYGNPGGAHEEGRLAKEALEIARLNLARLVGVKTDAVIFTSGATEGNNMALRGVVEKRHSEGLAYSSMHILCGSGAHASLTQTLSYLATLGVVVEYIPYENNALSMAFLENALREDTVLVCVESVAGETGAWTNTRDIKRILDRKKSSALLHVDASQAPLIEKVERSHFGADLIVLDAQKIGGVRGIGVLILSVRVGLAPIIFGGGQEQGLRSGTPSPAHAIAFSVALTEVQKGREQFLQRAVLAREKLVSSITSQIEQVMVNEAKENAPHILNISLLGRDTDYLVALLNEAGFAVSTKSACETLDDTGSRGVLALTGEEARAKSTLRISWGPDTTQTIFERFINALVRSVAFIDRHSL